MNGALAGMRPQKKREEWGAASVALIDMNGGFCRREEGLASEPGIRYEGRIKAKAKGVKSGGISAITIECFGRGQGRLTGCGPTAKPVVC
jgi:hypothetical protein